MCWRDISRQDCHQRKVIAVDNTFTIIQNLSKERQQLFDLGASQKLSDEQRQRIDEITGRLPGLWETYRRELASEPNRR
jgi:hypothetical protein